ncbi:signal peptide peptidase SppA [Roseimarinus sediminis]|uniref:signal peptide peptidase SppA n=1 Tax=Roseimarinus sediminis TaxID=1610899 RepID=UPI003D1FD1CC
MRSFLKYTLASITGIIIASLLGFFIMAGIFSAIVASSEKEVHIKDHSVLVLKLDAQLSDRAPNNPFQDLELPGFEGSKRLGLDEITEAIEKAKHESKIKGIYLKLDNVMGGYAMAEEIRNALADFKQESGKFVYAYSSTYSQKAYYLASVADKVFINPEGMLEFAGLASQHSFYKNALEKLGIEVQVIRHGKFKAAVEPFMLEEMSAENREQIEVYIGSIWNNVVNQIGQSRGLSPEKLNQLADKNMTFQPAGELLASGLVDSIVYEDQFLDFLREATGTAEDKEINAHSVADMKSVAAPRKGKGLAKDKIAVIYGIGEIGMSASPFDDESISGPYLAREIRKARKDSTIKAIVFRINSPGGSSLASDLIWREVVLAQQLKPVVVSMGDVAASGGYYIACAADSIVANPTTITGSIGVFGLVPNMEELFEDKLGINNEVVKTNELSDLPSVTRPMSTIEKAQMQNMVETVYDTFVKHVAEGRNMSYEAVDAIGQGRVWTGENAKELGLVDVLGNLDTAIDIAAELAQLENYRTVQLPKQKDPIAELMEGFSSELKYRVIKNELGEGTRYYKTLEKIKNSRGILTRMPYEVVIE